MVWVGLGLYLGCATHSRLVRQDEEVIINDLRAIQEAQATFATVNKGFYGTLECLAEPWSYFPNYPSGAPAFLSKGLAALTPENGYERHFFGGPRAGEFVPEICEASFTAWAYTAVPVSADKQDRRAFCADSTGKICVVDSGSFLVVADGECVSPCERVK
jgi:hypothetical protein